MILFMILICIGLILMTMAAKPLKALLRIAFNGVIGCGGIFLVNSLFGGFGLQIGINLLNAVFIGVLGLPGFGSLVLISCILS